MPQDANIHLKPLGVQDRVLHGTPLIDILHTYGVEFPCGGKGTCGRCHVKILKGDLGTTDQHDNLAKRLNLPRDERLACMSFVNQDVDLEIGQYDTIILGDNSVFDFTPQTGLGIAIDLGTTTIIGQLLDLSNGKIINTKSVLNSQSKYGADIMSRINFAVNHDGLGILYKTVRKDIFNLVKELTPDTTVDCKRIVLVGNSVMQHIFCNLDLTSLSVYPFESHKHEFVEITADHLGLHHLTDCRILFYPSIGSFIGSDILAGIISIGMHDSLQNLVLIDLGTNGEICIGNRDRIICASTAAGPAFEGTNISMGMTASTGAISSLFNTKGRIDCHTIGNVAARGICGSGLIDAISLFHEIESIDSAGRIKSSDEKIMLEEKVFLTQKDIYEFLLAKGAIASGIEILCSELGIKNQDIESVFIAGAFGNFINLENAVKVGLLEFPTDKITRIGNTALIGAKIALFQDQQDWMEVIQKCQHISLESFQEFQDIFASKMFLS